jgi:4-amino-4-deoxy-L-arabinose transferase-like glycosyltransferase
MFHRKRRPPVVSDDTLSQDIPSAEITAPLRLSAVHRLLYFARDMKRYVCSSDRRVLQLITAAACLFVSLAIGVAYSSEHYVRGWQLWAWLLCCVIMIVALAPIRVRRLEVDANLRALLIVTVVAFLLRATLLDVIPGGLHPDETGTARFTMEQVYTGGEQTISPFVVSTGSHPTLYHYLIKLFMSVFGYTAAGVRSSSALAGTLAVLATYGCVAVWNNRRMALIAAILIATYHFHVHWSRLALNNIWDTVWIPAMIGAYAWGWKNRNSAGAALAGAALGFSQYFYQGGRVGVFVLLFAIVWLWWNDRDNQRLTLHLGKLAAVSICVAGPLFLYAITEPGPFFERFNTIFGWQPAVIQETTGSATGYWQFFWYQLARSVGAYTAYTDITGFYRPQTPLTIGISMLLLPIGFGWAIFKRMWVPVVWLTLATFFGGFLLSGAPSSSHYVTSIPAICWLIAIAIDLLNERGHPRLALATLAIVVVTDLVFYFGIYLQSPSLDLSRPFPVPFS